MIEVPDRLPLRVLLFNPERDVLEALADLLEQEGYTIEAAMTDEPR